MGVSEMSRAEIYEKHADALVRFANGLVGPSDAGDVVSAAVIRSMWSPAWPEVVEHRAYLYRAVLREAQMHHRSTMRRRAREARAAGGGVVHEPMVRPEVLEAVRGLNLRQRGVVFLTYWEGLTSEEIAQRLGLHPGSVRRLLARARSRLKGSLNE